MQYSQTSAKMAMALGIFLPIVETIRRSNQLLELAFFLDWFDDYLLGALLVITAYNALKYKKDANLYLLIVWSIAVGGHFLSCLGQLKYYFSSIDDPGIFSTHLVLVVKLGILLYILVGLRLSIKQIRLSETTD